MKLGIDITKNRLIQQHQWLIGTFELRGHRIPVVEFGATREDARARARESLDRVWTTWIELEKLRYPGADKILEGVRRVLYRDDETADM